ncbi:MAG TPA: FAD-dependent oxidoreductase [Anaerovoracaceae bacterium]|nr:FAD-dependent oxidoreductase [Anaerovoracaceae bacterium]
MSKEIYMPVSIGGVIFKNPFYVSSGPTTKSVQQLKRIEETGWAAASIKLTIDPAPYINRVPRYAVFEDRNALCFTAEKRLAFQEGLTLIEDAKKVLTDLIVMANITYAGDEGVAGWINMAKKFEEVGADIIELNMCCPNMSYNVEISSGDDKSSKVQTGASLGQQGEVVAEIVREIKKNINIPLFVKLTPEGGRIAQVAKVLYAAGADAVGGTANRLGIPPIDLDDPGKAVYHLQKEISMSCHSSTWLKPLAQRDTYEIRKVNGPGPKIMATGGIRNYRDAAEMFMCGADLIGICSETLISGYGFIRGLISDLQNYMDEHGYKSTMEMRDIIVPLVKTAPELTLFGGYAKITEPLLSAPCKTACPHNVPAQAYVQKVAQGDFRAAYDLIISKNPLQSVCGWICNHPCETECTRGEIGVSIPIREIKRFVIEYGRKSGWKPDLKVSAGRNEKVAVIGSGPAGLSCAYNLALAGYSVKIFEKEKYLGGMLRYGLPRFRMNHEVLDTEIELLISLGIEFATEKKLGKDITIESLKSDGYSAVFLGIGAHEDRKMNLPGENAKGVISALSLLKDVYDKKQLNVGKNVVIVGGGFTAIDAARTVKRLGAEQVYITYRRTKDEMPATQEEITEAEAEGIKVMYLVAPKSIEVNNGNVTGIKMVNQVLGDKDLTNRRRPEEVSAAEFILPCETIISAIGQKPNAESINGIRIDKQGMVTTVPATGATNIVGVFAGGDITNVDSVIAAIASGKASACSIDRMIAGDDAVLETELTYPVVTKEAVLRRVGYFKDDGIPDLYTMKGQERITNFSTYIRTLSETEAVAEAKRCLNCGCGEGCGLCATICSEFAIHIKSPDVWEINSEECVACGMCFTLCPNKNIEMVSTNVLVK